MDKVLSIIKATYNQAHSAGNYVAGFSRYMNNFMTPYLLATNYFSRAEVEKFISTSPLEGMQSYAGLMQFNGELSGRNAGVEGTLFDRQFKDLMQNPLVLGSDGAKWQRIAKTHPLYYSFFDFEDGPPMGGASGGNVFDLEMLELRGRIAVVFSDLNISWYWGDPFADARERGLQFGVNLIVYALTQPGGIANVQQYAQ